MALTTIDDRGLKTPIDLLDNEKIRFGTGNDLELYHTGSHSYMTNPTGWLIIGNGGHGVSLRPAENENGVYALANGAVELYYDNAKKFETTSAGVTLTGGGLTIPNGWNTQWGANASRAYIQGEDASGNNRLILGTNNTLALTLDSSQNATFAGEITKTGSVVLKLNLLEVVQTP